jgi:hypothetical protein
MPAPCPRCSSAATYTFRTRQLRNGTIRRRRACHDCEFRWTVTDGPLPPRAVPPLRNEFKSQCGLTQDDVLQILESPLSDKKTAAVYDCTRQAIANIRTGKAFGYLYPHIKRRDLKQEHAPKCTNCSHWNDSTCSFGFPEADEDPAFAAECQLFNLR